MSKTFDLSLTERSRLEQVEGIIFDIQRYSVHDGPGLRTNVFFKGCPLHCGWCANPESQSMQPELVLSEVNCISCGQFETPCPICWAEQGESGWSREQLEEFDERTAICPTGAIHWIGERRTAGDIMREVRRDAPFYAEGGGLTLTGGEVTMQPDLAEALLRLAQAEGISTAMETCGHTRWPVLERLLPYLDHILYDLKQVDTETHRKFTGLGNELILDNLRWLVAAKAPLTIRVPLIPGLNASAEPMRAIAGFVRDLGDSRLSIHLLPYHTLGQSKYKALGRTYPWAEHDRLMTDEVNTLARLVESYGLMVKVGG
ncbi:MAG: glycyl-radical enzyme activating protein [Anaerolineales bacterium]|nr:glycyl-radical enzyme activating protein [Anaerolineales bacterium]